MGLLATGTSCLALVCVMGRSRVPAPPQGTRAFTTRRPALVLALVPGHGGEERLVELVVGQLRGRGAGGRRRGRGAAAGVDRAGLLADAPEVGAGDEHHVGGLQARGLP